MLAGLDHHEYSTDRQRYLEWDRRRLANLIGACDVSPPLVTQVISDLWDARRPEALRVYPEAEAVLLGLRARGITVGLCSNWDWDLDEDVAELGLAACFDLIVSSARAGARKPNERIYRYALEMLGLPANKVLFVGDTLISDVEGPLRLGMRAVYLRRASQSPWPGLGTWGVDHGGGDDEELFMEPAAPPAGVPSITDLGELADLVVEGGAQGRRFSHTTLGCA
jgi:putative hydrolase of the HAD superfamily